MRELRCADAGFDCDAVIPAETDEEVLARAGPHAQQGHGLEMTPEVKGKLAGLVHDA